MSKKWYPVIDYTLCNECGICTDKCTHGVYNKEKAPVPVVISPDGCIEGCRGCGSICPFGAISYVGEGLAVNSNGGCGCDDSGCSQANGGGCCG